jgi:hypothetical protein
MEHCFFLIEISDADREHVLTKMFSQFSESVAEDREILCCPLSLHSGITFQSALIEVANSITSQLKLKDLLPKRFTSYYMENMKKEDPFEFIQEILSFYQNTHLTLNSSQSKQPQQSSSTSSSSLPPLLKTKKLQLILPFFFYEKLQNSNLLSLLINKFQQQNWNTIFFVATHQYSLQRQSLMNLHSLQFSSNYSRFSICSPLQLLDDVVVELLVKKKLPVHFPHNIMDILFNEFYDYTMCLTTLFQR